MTTPCRHEVCSFPSAPERPPPGISLFPSRHPGIHPAQSPAGVSSVKRSPVNMHRRFSFPGVFRACAQRRQRFAARLLPLQGVPQQPFVLPSMRTHCRMNSERDTSRSPYRRHIQSENSSVAFKVTGMGSAMLFPSVCEPPDRQNRKEGDIRRKRFGQGRRQSCPLLPPGRQFDSEPCIESCKDTHDEECPRARHKDKEKHEVAKVEEKTPSLIALLLPSGARGGHG